MSRNQPIECTEGDKAAANEAFDYARFALARHGYDLTADADACAKLVLAIIEHMKETA